MKRLRLSLNGRIFAATVMIAGIGSVVKIVSLGKEMLVSRCFGAGDALDAFYVAFLLPTFLVGIIVSSCNEAFIPTYVEVRENEGIDAAQRVFAGVAVINVAALIVLWLVLAGSQQWLLPVLGSGFSPKKLVLTRALFFILLVSLFISGLNALWRAVLNAHECFAVTAIAPITIPLMTIIVLLASPPDWRIYGLVTGSVAGVAAELVILGYSLRSRGMALVPRWHGFDRRLRQVIKQAMPSSAAGILMGCTGLVDQSMAAMLHSGSVSSLNYANKLIPVLLGIGSSSLSVAILPALSRLSAGRDWRGVHHIVSSYTRLIFLIGVPATVTLIALSEPIVRMFFEGGAFTSQSTRLVASVQSLLCLQVPFYAASMLCVSALCALKRNDVLIWGTTIAVFENVALNYLFMKMFGLAGIALSTSVVYITAFVYLRFMLGRALRRRETESVDVGEPLMLYGLSSAAESPAE
jgi:putative peptidoglycan lipid II flippase